ncbi:M23 family metallopeptidase [Vaginella massiliensis]|uniref:M23 family metallopeptidase n=1 Tax=Vaginella massiliensis TaxID=1816680 RepID=UPI0008387637|nr:M23 family metallopeptidase [Vaginella massiliensis]
MENKQIDLEPTNQTYTQKKSIFKQPKYKALVYGLAFILTAVLSGSFTSYIYTKNISLPSEQQMLTELNQNKKDFKKLEKEYKNLVSKMAEAQHALEALVEKDEEIYRSVYGLESLPSEVRLAGFGGSDRYSDLRKLPNGKFVAEVAQNMDVLLKKLEFQAKSMADIKAVADGKEKEYASIPAIQPIADKSMSRVASGFGVRFHPILKIHKMHNGLDFAAPVGTPIYATADGVVSMAGSGNGYGNMVKLNHGNGYETLYAHMSKIKVRNGQRIKRGDVIGNVGNTGMSTGAHLHYEIHHHGKVINPIDFFYKDLSPDEFVKMYEETQKTVVSLD